MFDNKTDYSGVSFVFAGAFGEITDKTNSVNSIGFHKMTNSLDDTCLDDELVKNGLIPELVGRITHIVELDRFDKDMYLYILNDKLLPKKRMDLAAYGVFELDIPDKDLELIAERAAKSNQGVRYLQRALDTYFLSLEFEAGLDYSIYNDH